MEKAAAQKDIYKEIFEHFRYTDSTFIIHKLRLRVRQDLSGLETTERLVGNRAPLWIQQNAQSSLAEMKNAQST